MIKKFAYITLLYPNKNGDCVYLDGALLMALGLRRQNVKYEIICMVTPDVSNKIIDILKILYDKIITVDYITPIKNKGINIISEIFSKDNYISNNKYKDICHVFTKLHIFNSEKFPYDKIVFIDTDIIPIKKYDELFDLDVPAGWVEQILEMNTTGNTYTKIWGRWENLKHGKKIPDFITNIYEKPGSCVNAGLLLIKPDKNLFNIFIKQLQTPKQLWFGKYFTHKGCIDINGNFVDNYPFPEQCYLTQHFSGQWKMIDGLYATWRINKNSYGMHMAGLKYLINGEMKEHKSWNIQIPEKDGFNDITNIIALWGLENYPQLKYILMNNLKIRIENNLIDFNSILKNDNNYLKLNKYQQQLYDFIF
jgi:hypothetical protein